MAQKRHRTSLIFDLLPSSLSSLEFGPRLGKVTLQRHGDSAVLEIATPSIITSTSRGVVPHLSRDTTRATEAIYWAHVPFESFLERDPPVPTLQQSPHPLHKFLGFLPHRHILSMSLRDPFDAREMPPNGHDSVSAYCIRGMRKVKPNDWRKHVLACNPDIVVALSDIPFTPEPHSQKRMTKSIERTAVWLANLLQPIPVEDEDEDAEEDAPNPPSRLNVFVHMAGGTVTAARAAFSQSLMEPLYEHEASHVEPFKSLDEGVAGYTFDLVPLHKSLSTPAPTPAPSAPFDVESTVSALEPTPNVPSPATTARVVPLMHTSLAPLPKKKLRIVNSASSPHEMLLLIRDVGIDAFDAHWAQRAADIGVALDFAFPVPPSSVVDGMQKKGLGHNLYDARYAHDFSPFSDTFHPSRDAHDDARPVCACIACSPKHPTHAIHHSFLDGPTLALLPPTAPPPDPVSRAYTHHLLHTHEMSAHALLASHNIFVLDLFFSGIRHVLRDRPDEFAREVDRFLQAYDEALVVFEEAKHCWAEVEMARGKGRLAREREKQQEDTLGTAVEL
ncbi:hypothetical protein EW146_g4570 [Bondarzewia mesenterica]|uniref:tRNA-guanine(15) transglycosylase-like domain-containing protein n=1 Tax=Bondarzewia mesenterica TaxID=1095465 RepID=A0A4S4LU52_9AGAM|nr:hypothetical protein EW146_g4570 [Bondarzewia mesenterica]